MAPATPERILVVNTGSSSVKYQLIDMAGEHVLAKGQVAGIGGAVRDHDSALATVFDEPGRVGVVANHCLREGHLILMSAGTDGTVLRWMPPLVVSAAEIDEALAAFADALKV